METIIYKGQRINIEQDGDPESPREWDNLGTMVCWHNNYNLGDGNGLDDVIDEVQSHSGYNLNMDDCNHEAYRDITDPMVLISVIDKLDSHLYLPLFLYDHSGISISASEFSCRWDSGQIGFILISKNKIRSEYGVKRISKKLKKRIYSYLLNEVSTYDDYLQGEVYCYTTITDCGEEIGCCSGYYGYEHDKSGLLEQAKSSIDYYVKQRFALRLQDH